MGKKIAIGSGAAVVVIGITLFVLVANLDKIVQAAIEGVGSELLGVAVAVDEVTIDLKSGTGQIRGMSIANPNGFAAPNAFRMDTIRLALDLGSLRSQPVVVNELTVENPVVELEAKADGTTNLQLLVENIRKNSARADEKAADEHPSAEGSGDEAKRQPVKLSFGKLSITGVTVNAVVPGQEPARVVIPDIIRENVGGEGGFTPAQVGGVIIGDIVAQSLEAVLERKLSETIDEAARGLFDSLKGKLREQ